MNSISLFGALTVIVLFSSSCSQTGEFADPESAVVGVEATEGTDDTKTEEAVERSMTYAIQNSEGKHLGFLLMVGDAASGDCVFRSLPAETELFDTAETKLLYEMQLLGEFSYLVTENKVTFTHPRFSRKVSMADGLIEADGIVFRVERVKKS